jgi:hypothetical protein
MSSVTKYVAGGISLALLIAAIAVGVYLYKYFSLSENQRTILKMRKQDVEMLDGCEHDILGKAHWYKVQKDEEGKPIYPTRRHWFRNALHDSIIHSKKCKPNPIDPLDTLYASFETPVYRKIWDRELGKDVKVRDFSPDW